jgi:hypothetical protein
MENQVYSYISVEQTACWEFYQSKVRNVNSFWEGSYDQRDSSAKIKDIIRKIT